MSQPSRVTATSRREATPAGGEGPRPPRPAAHHPADVRRVAHEQAARRTARPQPRHHAVPPAHAGGDGLRRRRGAAPWHEGRRRGPLPIDRASRGRSTSESPIPKSPSRGRRRLPDRDPRIADRSRRTSRLALRLCAERRAELDARLRSACRRGGRVAARSRRRTVGALRRDAREGHWQRRLMNASRCGPLRAARPVGSRIVRTSCDSRRGGTTARRCSVTAQPDATNVSPES